jgi:hypothetical protein
MITFFENGGNILKQSEQNSLYINTPGRSNKGTGTPASEGQFYEIRVKGQPSAIWADWFEGLTTSYLDDDEMLLSGYIVDQSALMGILNKLVRLNLTLISLHELKK